MDDKYTFELDEVFHTIQTAEVITFRFVVINQRLLVDSRHTEIDAPLIKVVPKVSSAYERFRSLKKLRPRFRVPDKICSVAWPKRVETLVTSGVWSSIVDRVSQAGFADAQSRCEEALQELFDLERREIRKAIEGDDYGTLWEHTP